MARKKTSTSKGSAKPDDAPAKDTVEDQVQDATDAVEDLVSDEAETAETLTDELDALEEAQALDDDLEDIVDAELVLESDDPNSVADTADVTLESEPDSEIADASDSGPDVPVETRTIVERRGGFIPLLLGGLLAGGVGFGASYYLGQQNEGDLSSFQKDVSAKLDQNSSDIATLSESLSALPEPANLDGVLEEQGNLSASLDSLVDRLNAAEEQFAALDDRLTQVEKRPISEGASDAAVAAYERELKALQDTMAAQRAEIEAMASEAQSMESNAEETAKATMLRAALSRVQTALDSGGGFAPALGDLQAGGIEIPAALSEVAEDGVASLAELQTSFPDAARAALAVARQEAAESGEQSGFSAFLKNQLGTRSLEPREGDDPDAVLSRAEAAAREGRLADVLAEIEALPESGRAALSDWTTNVTRRQAAISAAEALVQELN